MTDRHTPFAVNVERERRQALRALLRSPLLPSSGETADDYVLVRRHSVWLKNWLAKFPAWTLHIDKTVARLRKTPADLVDETRPAVDRASGSVFTRRRYVFVCLALAALERMDRQTTLVQLAKTIFELAAADRDLQMAGLIFERSNYDQRRDLVHAVRLLIDTGVLRRLDGDEQQFLSQDDSPDVLYDINRPILVAMLNVSRSASSIEAVTQNAPQLSPAERAASLLDNPIPDSVDSRKQSMRTRIIRALLDDPVLYFHDLNDDEVIYLDEHRGYLLRHICDATGLTAEVRAEGIALVDDAADLTDVRLPAQGADGDLGLALARWFAERYRAQGRAPIPVSSIEDHVRETGAEPGLISDALSRLRALRLIELSAAGVVPLPACGRYRA